MSLAYLTDSHLGSEKLYFALHPRTAEEQFAPTSAIVRLIQGIYAHDPANALRIVRNRVFSTAPATEMCHGMVKVAAKRLTDSVPKLVADEVFSRHSHTGKIDVSESFNALSNPLPFEAELAVKLAGASGAVQSDEQWMKTARALLPPGTDLPVAALLLSHDGQILASAVNSNSQNRTFHAEVNLIQSFYRTHRRKIPAFAKIITTLKPCKMCAAMIWTAAEKIESLQVIFGEMDDGNHARETVLNADTFERKRASRTPAQLVCQIERPLT